MPPTDVLVVSGEALWPSSHGGRVRTARIVEQVARHLQVRVLAPAEGEPPIDVPFDVFPSCQSAGRWRGVASSRPRLGQALLSPARRQVLRTLVKSHRPRVVLFAHSYLAAMVPAPGPPIAIDFADIEVRRMASFARHGSGRARAASGWEWIKARRWEPAVARRAVLCSATSESDVALLRAWGGGAVLVPHGSGSAETAPSPPKGPVTFVASFGYAPNREAARFLVEEVWPRLHRAEPGLCLRLVGRQADAFVTGGHEEDGVEVVSDPETVDALFRQASVVVAPVRAGGGSQVKVSEALAQGRVVVATPFSACSAPAGADGGMVVADRPDDFAEWILRLWRDPAERWGREQRLVHCRPVPSWEQACAPLVEALLRLVGRR